MNFIATSFKDYVKKIKCLDIVFDYNYSLRVTGTAKCFEFVHIPGRKSEKKYEIVTFYNDLILGHNDVHKFISVEYVLGVRTTYRIKDSGFPLTITVLPKN